ncbi:MAG: hypothetical protein A4E45_01290 [Methanosaeta sp. PtaB.Bin039]|nr:MAG: hypothetical protein A4E45_01290 [Methanosaeta sp. PtaB.Bin039]OPY44577.1 MAG: hypothetical protein A4E47_01429 [Methanosaeta sp. PtaU1.Bin028]HOT06433.1 topoisomerase [Methanotrichaceae archaeon]HQF16204.1 topoisomerase [Methanotrichaceae archaeon]HQI90940.1 topoisomerase [Methanotrichaceae archaeon]
MLRDSRRKIYDLEALEELISALQEASACGCAIIVEGPRDRDSLRRLGISGPIILSSRHSTLQLAEESARRYRDIVILTDWDGKGEELARIMEVYLRPTGCRLDLDTRRRLRILTQKEIKDVESLWHYVERARESQGV